MIDDNCADEVVSTMKFNPTFIRVMLRVVQLHSHKQMRMIVTGTQT